MRHENMVLFIHTSSSLLPKKGSPWLTGTFRHIRRKHLASKPGEIFVPHCLTRKAHALPVASLSDTNRHKSDNQFSNGGGLRHGRDIVRSAWATAVRPGDVCIDATCGRGSDTLSLACLAGSEGLIHALDIQRAAVHMTVARVKEAQQTTELNELARVHAIVKSHEDFHGLERVVPSSVSAIAYNLGWFPAADADRKIITAPQTTIRSLTAATEYVRVGGIITVTTYIGHEGGKDEADAVHDWVANLSVKEWSATHVTHPNRHLAPQVYILERIGRE